MAAYHKISNDPNLRLDMMRLLEQGETLTGIGRIYGVSRDRVRTQMKRFGLTKRPPFSEYSKEQVQTWVDRVIKGAAFKDIAEELSVDSDVVRRYLIHYGHDTEEIKHQRSLHRYDGMVYSNWAVLPGTYRVENNNTVLDCRCVCGEERTVSLTNLMGGASKSCGCVGFTDRQSYPWVCTQTGQTVRSTKELSNLLGANYMTIARAFNRNGKYVDKFGNEWLMQTDKPVPFQSTKSTNITWVCIERKEKVVTCKALAQHIGAPLNTIKWYAQDRRPYTSKSGDVWTPI